MIKAKQRCTSYDTWPGNKLGLLYSLHLPNPIRSCKWMESVCWVALPSLFQNEIWRTQTLINLHWLRVPERVSFKLAVMTFRSIHGTSPSYLQSCFARVSDMTSRRRLLSSTSHRLDVPPVRLSTVGKRTFPVSGATVWNDLPPHVASAPSFAVFKQRLKTFLFSRSYHETIIWLICYCYHSSLNDLRARRLVTVAFKGAVCMYVCMCVCTGWWWLRGYFSNACLIVTRR